MNARAELQRGLAIEALTSLVQGIQDQLASRPGTLELRRSLLELTRAGLSRVPPASPIAPAKLSTIERSRL